MTLPVESERQAGGDDSRSPARRWLAGLAAASVLPVVLLGDTLVAVARGWPMAELGALVVLPGVAVLWLVGMLLVAATARGRRLFDVGALRLALLAGGIAVGLACAEVALRATRPSAAFHLRPPGAVYEFEPERRAIYGVAPRSRSSINSQGLRGPERPAGAERGMRVLCIGGSTTECYWLDDRQAWPAVVGEKLAATRPAWVAAAAVSELATGHHRRFIAESPLIERGDVLVVMPGANDLCRLLLGLGQGVVEGPWWTRLRIVTLAKEYWNGARRNGFFVDRTGAWLQRTMRLGRAIPEPATPLDLERAVADYGARLEALVDAAEARGARLVLVTQPVLWGGVLTPQGPGRLVWAREKPYPRAWGFLNQKSLRDLSDRMNAELRRVARRREVPVVDAAAVLNGQEPLFYDDFHLNADGCQRLGGLVAEGIMGLPERPVREAGPMRP